MSNIAITAEGLGKRYQLGKRERYRTLRDTLTDTLAAPFRRLRRGGRSEKPETFWALRDVSFEVKHGDVVGIIGRNGAGKSTLLKILARITEPTEGQANIHGRIASLLEVGTGFHPELTGRENTFLNGAILGMKKAEIRRKFDEIVDFAGVEKFIDTPVKHYSSGMYVRLAFAVAAHLEPEILVVDEVLAVGDAAFQEKCLGKMNDVARQGRTIFFVSHNLSAVSRLCSRGILLESGRVTKIGSVSDVLDQYARSIHSGSSSGEISEFPHRRGAGFVRVATARVFGEDDVTRSTFSHGEDICCELALQSTLPRAVNCRVELFVRTATGTPVLHLYCPQEIVCAGSAEAMQFNVRCILGDCQLYPGTYMVSAWIGASGEDFDVLTDILAFRVEPGPLTELPYELTWRTGLFIHPSTWEITKSDVSAGAMGQHSRDPVCL